MHTVPGNLRGASLGAAHKWVRSQTSAGEYSLSDANGNKVSLTDLISGHVSEVQISSTRNNPAHPAVFEPIDYGINTNVNLTHILPDEVTPAMVTSMVHNEGLFGAVQSLSMLLNREVTEESFMTPGAMAILSARTIADQPVLDSRLIRTNPDPIGFGRSRGGRLLGQEVAQMDMAMKKHVEQIVNKQLADAKTTADIATIEKFVRDVLTPYLLAAEANRQALKYISQYVVPSANRMGYIKEGDLDAQFKHIAHHMATSPRDFYYGKQYALIAHPGFLFPQYGAIALPTPTSKKEKKVAGKIFSLMLNAGNPPRFEGNQLKMRTDDSARGRFKSITPPIEWLNQSDIGVGPVIDWEFIKDRMKKFDIGGVIRGVALASKSATRSQLEEPHVFVEAFKKLSKKDRQEFIKDVADKPVMFIMDLPGIHPRPLNWPDKLVMASMEVLAKYRGKDFDFPLAFGDNDFLGNSIEAGIITFEHNGTDYSLDLSKGQTAWDGLTSGVTDPMESKAILSAGYDAVKNSKLKIRVSKGLSLTNLLTEAVSLSISKYEYEPSKEDIKLATAILLVALSKLDESSGYVQVSGLADRLSQMVEDSSREAGSELSTYVGTLVTNAEGGNTADLAALMALRTVLKGG